MSTQKRKFSDILRGSNQDAIKKAFSDAKAAEEFKPIPSGEYVAHLVGGEFFTSKTSATPGYKFEFQVLEGDHDGRRLWLDIWFTEDAMPLAKRDLGKLGVNDIEQLNQPMPQGIRCKLKVALRKDDDGTEYNRVRSFEVLGIDPPEDNPFAPSDDNDPPKPSDANSATSFAFGANAESDGPYREGR